MIDRILSWFGLAVVDLDHIARQLAADTLEDWRGDLWMLNRGESLRSWRSKYLILAARYGLPTSAAGRVADMAWRYVADAHDEPVQVQEFAFYE